MLLEIDRTIIHPQFHPTDPDWIAYSQDPAPRMWRVRRDGSGNECLYEHGNDEFLVHETFLGDGAALIVVRWPYALLRFDLVYYAHFKCNLARIQDLPALWGFVRDVFQTPGVRETCRLGYIKTHYYWSQTSVSPTRIVPLGPTIDFDAPHDRARLGGAASPRSSS